MKFIKSNLLIIGGVLIGALVGFLYWKYTSCLSGGCAITSNPYNSTIYGSVVGGLLFSFLKKEEKNNSVEDDI